MVTAGTLIRPLVSYGLTAASCLRLFHHAATASIGESGGRFMR